MIVATIGFFDGVHRGHLCLIRQVLEAAQKREAQSLIVTMHPHPKAILQPRNKPSLLTLPPEKIELLQNTGIDCVKMLHFDAEMSRLTATAFMQEILKKNLGVSTLVMGYEHQFGHGGGTLQQYIQWGKDCGIEVIRAREMEGVHVSSSIIRRLLGEGKILEANNMLGRYYSMDGFVVKGHQIGRELGFPTANLQVQKEKLIPAQGVYATWVVMPDGHTFQGMVNIGKRPTLADNGGITIEVHVLDFFGDLYGKTIRLEFLDRLRLEQRFRSLEELGLQLQHDAHEARKKLASAKFDKKSI